MKQTTLLLCLMFSFSFIFGQNDAFLEKAKADSVAQVAEEAALKIKADSIMAKIIYPVKFLITDTDDKPVANAEISIFTPQETLRRGKTDEAGKLSFFGLQDGDYDVLIQFENGENILFNNQWIATNETNERIYKVPAKKVREKKKKNN